MVWSTVALGWLRERGFDYTDSRLVSCVQYITDEATASALVVLILCSMMACVFILVFSAALAEFAHFSAVVCASRFERSSFPADPVRAWDSFKSQWVQRDTPTERLTFGGYDGHELMGVLATMGFESVRFFVFTAPNQEAESSAGSSANEHLSEETCVANAAMQSASKLLVCKVGLLFFGQLLLLLQVGVI